jgi:hypothetical protein
MVDIASLLTFVRRKKGWSGTARATTIMKHLEAFTLGKKFGHPEMNEDSLVIMPDTGYAVIDGVTDRNGTTYDGMLSGRFASRTVRRALETFLLAQGRPGMAELHYRGPVELIAYLDKAIHAGYAANGALERAQADWKLRGGCTVMLAFCLGDRLEVVAVGDSGARFNGTDVFQVLKPLDDVTSILRSEAWRTFAARGHDAADCDRLSASLTWQGTRFQPAGSPSADAIAEIEARALERCRRQLPRVPEWEFIELFHKGIAHGQGDFQNVTDRVLGYGGLDGFGVPEKYIETRSYRLADIESIELFSDGYFMPGEEFGVASWEKAFRQVEREDPHKIDRFPSTKGTTKAALTDDRTYLGVRLR